MKKLSALLAPFVIALLTAGCDSGSGSPAEPPTDFKVIPGDASAIATWTAQPDVTYWIFYGPGDSITTANWATSGGLAIVDAKSPRVITGLINGRTYSATINGRKEGGPGGSGAPTQVVVPQIAGTNWSIGTPLGTAKLEGVAAGTVTGGYASIAVGAGGALYSAFYGTGTTTPTNPAAPADLHAVWFGGGGFVAGGDNGTLLFSSDATTWTRSTSPVTSAIRGGTLLVSGGFVAVGDAGTILASANGTDWTALASGTSANLHAAAYGNGLYVVVGANGTILTSPNASTWTSVASGTTSDLRGVAVVGLASPTDSSVVNYTYVAVGAGGTVLTSSDATTWTAREAFTTSDLNAVVYGGQFVAVGSAGGIFTSADGITWQVRNSGTPNDLTAVVRTLSGYTVVGDKGTNLSSF